MTERSFARAAPSTVELRRLLRPRPPGCVCTDAGITWTDVFRPEGRQRSGRSAFPAMSRPNSGRGSVQLIGHRLQEIHAGPLVEQQAGDSHVADLVGDPRARIGGVRVSSDAAPATERSPPRARRPPTPAAWPGLGSWNCAHSARPRTAELCRECLEVRHAPGLAQATRGRTAGAGGRRRRRAYVPAGLHLQRRVRTVMLLAFTPIAVPTSATLPPDTLVQVRRYCRSSSCR